MRRTAVRSELSVLLLACAAACSDGSGPMDARLDSLPGLIVSQPLSGVAAAPGARTPAFGPGGALVYVSLVPGSAPTGLEATIRDQASGRLVTADVVDGGFDPVAIPADVGDTLVLTITRTGSSAPLRVVEPVKARRPPEVVRASPPPGGRDVPLNANVVIVFSTPIDTATLNTGTFQLWRDTTPVAGTVRLGDAVGVRVEFHPDTLLASETVYDLLVTQALHDVNGGALSSPLDVPFATGTKEQALALASLSVAGGYSCGVAASGVAWCWGINGEGELGTTTGSECGDACSTIPVAVAGGLAFQSVSAGLYHACGVTTSGAAYCWGSDSYGALGTDTTTLRSCYATPYHNGCPFPVPVVGGHQFRSISAGRWHTCGITTDGAAYCWGRNMAGELGADSATLAANCRSAAGCGTPVPVSGGLVFTAVSAGNALSCGVTAVGAAYCWGIDDVGQLGVGSGAGLPQCVAYPGATLYPCSPAPVAVTGGLTFTMVAATDSSACGLTSTGQVRCWGYNDGLLGTAVPLNTFATAPVRTGGDLTFTTLAVGLQYACGTTATGPSFCWGLGDNGVFGSGTLTHISTMPLQVAGGHTFQFLRAASGWGDHTCGLTTDGTAYCWGANVEGELGEGSTNPSTVPVRVAGQ
jgi:alpha-tubulin suppressor-like RCC1 family protein